MWKNFIFEKINFKYSPDTNLIDKLKYQTRQKAFIEIYFEEQNCTFDRMGNISNNL